MRRDLLVDQTVLRFNATPTWLDGSIANDFSRGDTRQLANKRLHLALQRIALDRIKEQAHLSTAGGQFQGFAHERERDRRIGMQFAANDPLSDGR